MAIDWGFEIFFLVAFTIGFVFVMLAWEQSKKEKRVEGGRVRCQCGYEYEGKDLPHTCPQCGKTLHESEH